MLESAATASNSEAIINTDNLKANLAKSCDTTTVNRWSVADIVALFELPFSDLMYQAQTVHRANFDPNAVQVSTLLSIKTGGCSEDCGYCPQAARYHTDVENEPLMALDDVLQLRRKPKITVQAVSVWAQPGADQNSAIWSRCLK